MRRSDLSILVVEDEAVIGILIEDILLELGCGRVHLAASVECGLSILAETSPDFAFLDINLNGTASYPVADVLKSRDIPFVFASAYATHPLDTVHAGEQILQKPFHVRDLETALERAVPSVRSVVLAA
jgi:CheY-like chemotaxis protein